jgi:hypothetical protein
MNVPLLAGWSCPPDSTASYSVSKEGAAVPTITIPRPGVTAEEIAEALRAGLGSRYNVLPGMRTARKPLAGPEPAQPDTILVGTGSNRLFTAQLTIDGPLPEHTDVRISPGGLGWETVVNSLRITRKVRQVLIDALIRQ